MIISKTPFRITLAGGGTDLPSFYQDHGGYVVSMAINKYIYVGLKKNVFHNYVKMRYMEDEVVSSSKYLKHDRAREALLLNGLHQGLEITSTADLPSKSGMGSSGSFLVSMIGAIKKFTNTDWNIKDICEEACHIEMNRLSLSVGKQDQYIAGYGGTKILNIDTNGNVDVSHLEFDTNSFINYCNIYQINTYRDAELLLKDQNKKSKSISFSEIKAMAKKFTEYLIKNDLDQYGHLLDDYWKIKKSLSKNMSNSLVDDIYQNAKDRYNILGGKIIGAGGGGFLMLFGQPSNNLDEYMKNNGMSKLEFDVEYNGLKVVKI
jgi:D-glycero-alpha-D-manno-heptose-7-phosphate kinase